MTNLSFETAGLAESELRYDRVRLSNPVHRACALRGNSLLFRLKVNRHFAPLLGEMAIGALRLRISRYVRCVLTLLSFSPTLLRPIGHHYTFMSRPRAQTLPPRLYGDQPARKRNPCGKR
jgi:hypothetical protein